MKYNTYLNGEMKEEVFGFKQSVHKRNNKINQDLGNMDFVPLEVELCVYVQQTDGSMIILCVDDIRIAVREKDAAKDGYEKLAGQLKMKKLGDWSNTQWLGVRVHRIGVR